MTALILILPSAVFAQESRQVTPAESFYGYVLQDFFRSFDSGIEGTYAEPVYGELISDDPDLDFYYTGFDIAEERLAAETDEVLTLLFSGNAEWKKGSAGQRLHDLYDSFTHKEEDRPRDEELFLACVRPLLEAEDRETFIKAALELYKETGISVLFDITAAQDGDTNQTYPMVSLSAPEYGAKVAFDPEIPEEIVTRYKQAIGDFAQTLGLSVSEADAEEAYRLQDVITHGGEILEEIFRVRRIRRDTPSENYSSDDRSDDYDRLAELHPGWTPEMPEFMNETDFAIFNQKDYAGLLTHISYTREELEDLNNSFPFLDFLDSAGFQSGKVILKPQDREVMENVELSEENLSAFKINAVISFAEKTGFTPSAAEDAMSRMKRAVYCALWGNEQAPEEESETAGEEALWNTVFALLPQDKGLLWAEKYYDESLTPRVTFLFEQLIDAYTVRIAKNDWLQDPEKDAIIKKLENMVPVIGIPTEENYVFPVIMPRGEGGTLLTNRIAICRAELEKSLRLVNEKGFYRKIFDQEIAYGKWGFDSLTINGANNLAFNSMIVSAGIIELLTEPGDDDTALLCKLGDLIGHEISHAFDDTGSLHDENGALVNWWSEGSRQYFLKLMEDFEAYYQNFGIIRDLPNNFEGDVRECLADFAGMTIVLDIIGEDRELAKQFFETQPTGLLRSVVSRAAAQRYVDLALDSHPLGASRINAPVSSADQFYAIYDINESDPMYTAPENRLHLW